jgi:hypothetical protein
MRNVIAGFAVLGLLPIGTVAPARGSFLVSPTWRAVSRRSASRLGWRWVRPALLGTPSRGA